MVQHKNDMDAHGLGSVRGYIGEYKDFNERSPFLGWAVRNGAVLANAEANHPELWKHLQKPENAWKCKTEAQWHASIHVDGLGGVNAFVVDTAAKTIRLPDTRGDYIAGAGWKSKNVGDSDGDAIRNIIGDFFQNTTHAVSQFMPDTNYSYTGVFKPTHIRPASLNLDFAWGHPVAMGLGLDASLAVPTDFRNHPATIYQLPCVYIGMPPCSV